MIRKDELKISKTSEYREQSEGIRFVGRLIVAEKEFQIFVLNYSSGGMGRSPILNQRSFG